MPLYDAHNHLADPVFDPHRGEIMRQLESIGLKRAVINGTCPDDWTGVLRLARKDQRFIPVIGLHPWRVNLAQDDWQAHFVEALEAGAKGIGEIGLDRWIKDHDIQRQQNAFRWQLDQARQRELPVSIHCLKAIGAMMETLRELQLPQRGIHLHAYNGPVELIPELVQLGAFFSFNGGQLKPGTTTVRDAIRAVPEDRLLIETDAPDFLPPEGLREFELPPSSKGQTLNHPANLKRAYEAIARLRGLSYEALADQVEANFQAFFGT